jgi:hypothetical protein
MSYPQNVIYESSMPKNDKFAIVQAIDKTLTRHTIYSSGSACWQL